MLLLTRFTASPHSRYQFESTSSWRVVFHPEWSLSTYLSTQAIALQARQWRRLSWTKALVRIGQYFIFMVASVAASSFVLIHAAWSLELLRMMLPCTCIGNFGMLLWCSNSLSLTTELCARIVDKLLNSWHHHSNIKNAYLIIPRVCWGSTFFLSNSTPSYIGYTIPFSVHHEFHSQLTIWNEMTQCSSIITYIFCASARAYYPFWGS